MKLTKMLKFAEYAQESHICIIPLETDFVLLVEYLLYSTWVFLLLSVLKSKLFKKKKVSYYFFCCLSYFLSC